jgi:hypothetical protein
MELNGEGKKMKIKIMGDRNNLHKREKEIDDNNDSNKES